MHTSTPEHKWQLSLICLIYEHICATLLSAVFARHMSIEMDNT